MRTAHTFFLWYATNQYFMNILDIFKDKLLEIEFRNKIKKELQRKALETVQKYKGEPMVEAMLLKDAIRNLYGHSSQNSDSTNITEDIYNNPLFHNLLREEVLKVMNELFAESQTNVIDEVSNKTVPIQETYPRAKNNNHPASVEKKSDENFVLPQRIRYFDRLKKCETAIKKGLIKTKEEETDYLIQLMEQEDELIQEGKLCPNCHALDTINNKHCFKCGYNIQ